MSLLLLSLLFLPRPALAAEELRTLHLSDGAEITARVRVPDSPKHPLPAVLIFGGFENAAKVLDLVHPRKPIVLASFDYPFAAERRWEFPQSLKLGPEVKRMVHQTREGIRLLIRDLARDSRVDSRRIYVLGASFGSPFAVTAAADERLVAGIAIVHGFGSVADTAAARLAQLWEPRLGFWARPAAWTLAQALWLYLDFPAPERSAALLRPGQRALMITAAQDRFVPQAASDSLWRGIEASSARQREQIVAPGDHLQPGSESKINDLLFRVEEWIHRVHRLSLPTSEVSESTLPSTATRAPEHTSKAWTPPPGHPA